jgi:hypothetical protein
METRKTKWLKANTLSIVNFGQLCSSLLGMTVSLTPAAQQRRLYNRALGHTSFFFGQSPTMQIEYGCFIMQG